MERVVAKTQGRDTFFFFLFFFFVSIIVVILLYCCFRMTGIFPSFMVKISQKL